MEQIKKYLLEIIFVLMSIVSLCIGYAFFRESPNGILTIAFLNVGQGDSIFIESPTKNRIIIDGGPNAALVTELGALVPWYTRWIDILLVTHPDSDHFAGFIDFLKRYEVGGLIESGVESDSKIYAQFKDQVSLQGTTTLALAGMIVDIGGGAYLDILFPDRDVTHMDTNDASIVAKLIYGSTSVMLTGDSPSSIEKYLVDRMGTRLDSDILKVGHHGSKTSTGESFVQMVTPAVAIISAGEDNRYGHPHQEVIQILEQARTTILRTDTEGTVIFQSDGSKFWRK